MTNIIVHGGYTYFQVIIFKSYLFQNLPRTQSPEVLGLHKNASMIRDLQDSKMFISSMTLIHGLMKKTESTKSESYLLEKIAKLNDMV